ncbi:hypothetical protein CR969_01590 [Candidatus Saccharibacteria bacterium]|nr:MAG: hypothetical protein CR969_01590 [Candidatus Saccharibacteria bacterium]
MAFENPDSTVKALKETTKDPESAAYVMRQSGYDDLLAFAKVDFVNLEDCVDLGSNGFERSLNSVKARLASQSLKAIRISQYGINPNVSGFDQAFFSGVAWAASEDFPTAEHLAVYVDEADRNMSNRVERFNPFSVPTIGKDVTGRVGSAKRYRHYELTDIPGRQYH